MDSERDSADLALSCDSHFTLVERTSSSKPTLPFPMEPRHMNPVFETVRVSMVMKFMKRRIRN